MPELAAPYNRLPCVALELPGGDKLLVAEQGAHVLSWQTADGAERLFLSPRAVLDGQTPIRGGVPVCFPQFNQRVLDGRALPKHGFARTLPWTLAAETSATAATPEATLRMTLRDSEATRQSGWSFAFEAALDVVLTPGRLRLTFSVTNTDQVAWPFALALHTYLRVAAIEQTRLLGLGGASFWDGVKHLNEPTVRSRQSEDDLRFGSETDRVYSAAKAPLQVQDGSHNLRVAQSDNFTETVVWNPGAALSAKLEDMPDDGFRHMLCVEAARIEQPVRLQPGERWSAWQELSVV
jgi:glucose-6-phosphate 1-epimerase